VTEGALGFEDFFAGADVGRLRERVDHYETG
jgi:hypothetical protein